MTNDLLIHRKRALTLAGKILGLAALAIVQLSPVAAQNGPPPLVPALPPAEPDAIPLYGDKTPGKASTEVWATAFGTSYTVRNVTRPTLTPVLPDPAKATGAAVIVLPGGGFMSLSMDHEGHEVARALAAKGIAAFVLKYRLYPTPADPVAAQAHIAARMKAAFSDPKGPSGLFNPDALSDAQAALRLVRARADEWKLDPERLGMIGFSAGARTSLRVVMESSAAERPRFFGYIYGDMRHKPVPADAPALFAAIAFDDGLYPDGNVALAQDWHAAKRPVELDVYGKGNHGFGLGYKGMTNALLLDEFVSWLDMQGFLKPHGITR